MSRGFDDLALSYLCKKSMWLWQDLRNLEFDLVQFGLDGVASVKTKLSLGLNNNFWILTSSQWNGPAWVAILVIPVIIFCKKFWT